MKPKKHYEPWSARDDDFLARRYLRSSIEYICQKLGRSTHAVRRRIVDLGLSRKIRRRLWNMSEVKFLRKHYAQHGAKWCAKHMQRTEKSIRNMAHYYGLVYQNPHLWNDADVLTLRRMWRACESVDAIAAHLSRSKNAIEYKARAIGLIRRKKVKK